MLAAAPPISGAGLYDHGPTPDVATALAREYEAPFSGVARALSGADDALRYYGGPHLYGALEKLGALAGIFGPQADIVDAGQNYREAIEQGARGEFGGAAASAGFGLLSNLGLSELSKPVSAAMAGAAMRAPLEDNYTKPLSAYAKSVWRDMAPEDALGLIPGSSVSASYGPMGRDVRYYADTPDLAIGQHGNTGVMMEFDPSYLQGQVNTRKPTWQHSWESGMAEYMASPAPDMDIRQGVRGIRVSKDALGRGSDAALLRRNIDRLKAEGWGVEEADDYISLMRPK